MQRYKHHIYLDTGHTRIEENEKANQAAQINDNLQLLNITSYFHIETQIKNLIQIK